MANRGRPTKPRTTELGRYIKECRLKCGWSVQDLASAAKVPYKTLSKLELGHFRPRRAGILQKIASAFDMHPDPFLLRASLTPILKPPAVAVSPPTPETKLPHIFLVDEDERSQLENYLLFLRFISEIGSIYRSAETQ